jgi:hypothetical protein
MEAAWFSEMLISNHHTTWNSNPENHEFCLHHCENLNLHGAYICRGHVWRTREVLFLGIQIQILTHAHPHMVQLSQMRTSSP